MNRRQQRRAYHALMLSDGTRIDGPVVVCFDDNDEMLSWHFLHREEPFTEWIGGLYDSHKAGNFES